MTTAQSSKPEFSGRMIDIGLDITIPALVHYLQVYKDNHPSKPANTILVFRDIDVTKIKLPDTWADVTIKPWPYIHAKNIIMVGVWS